MKNKRLLVYILILPIIIIIGIFTYWYLNPSIGNEDFHLQYILSDPKEDFYKIRNDDISKEKYTFNNQIYNNDIERYKLIVHSIDFTKYGEKILIVTDYFDKKERLVNLTYKNKESGYSPVEILRNKDSIFIYQLFDDQTKNKNLIFKGLKIR